MMRLPRDNGRVSTSNRLSPNPLLSAAGLVGILGGIGLVVLGIVAMVEALLDPGAPPAEGGEEFADGGSQFFWGMVVMTIGRYLWRGARRRGVKDRVGRLLIIGGYVLIGVALSAGTHGLVGLMHTDQVQATVREAGVLAAGASRVPRRCQPVCQPGARHRGNNPKVALANRVRWAPGRDPRDSRSTRPGSRSPAGTLGPAAPGPTR
jgi:hypothetical protein